MTRRMFPVLRGSTRAEREENVKHGCPREVPWDMLDPHADWAQRNHSQTLTRLAERGGLAPCEMVAIIERRRHRTMTAQESIERLLELVAEFKSRNP